MALFLAALCRETPPGVKLGLRPVYSQGKQAHRRGRPTKAVPSARSPSLLTLAMDC